jgi:hypothetical protein
LANGLELDGNGLPSGSRWRGFGWPVRCISAALVVLLTGCQIEALAPVSVSQIATVARGGAPATLVTTVLLTFTSGEWCRDMGASLVASLETPALNLEPIGCQEDPQEPGQWHGELRLRMKLSAVADLASNRDMKALLEGDLARIGVATDPSQPSTLTLAVLLDMPRLEAARARLLTFPALRDSPDAQQMDSGISLILKNDLAQSVTLISHGATTESQPALKMPTSSVRTITLSKDAMAKLADGQPVLLRLQVQ